MEVTEKLVKEEERSAELYVSVHGGLDHTFLIKNLSNIIELKDSSCNLLFYILVNTREKPYRCDEA